MHRLYTADVLVQSFCLIVPTPSFRGCRRGTGMLWRGLLSGEESVSRCWLGGFHVVG